MEITKREILVSTLILAVMVGIGVWVSSPIMRGSTERYLDTMSSVSVTDSAKFDYIRRTDVGRFVAEGTLSAIDVVTIPELPRPYSYIRKVQEEYRLHTETYTTTDGKGHTTVHTRTYHSWDEIRHWTYETDSVSFLGQHFKAKEVFRYRPAKDTTIKAEKRLFHDDTRFIYYTCPITYDGIMTGTAKDKTYNEPHFKEGKTVDWYFKDAEASLQGGYILFWVLWILLTGGVITLFYCLENKWLY
jgi:hypothetical protein